MKKIILTLSLLIISAHTFTLFGSRADQPSVFGGRTDQPAGRIEIYQETGKGGVLIETPAIFKAVDAKNMQEFKSLLKRGDAVKKQVIHGAQKKTKTLKQYLNEKLKKNPNDATYKKMKALIK